MALEVEGLDDLQYVAVFFILYFFCQKQVYFSLQFFNVTYAHAKLLKLASLSDLVTFWSPNFFSLVLLISRSPSTCV